ncbi:MAG: hypothetical protein ACLSFT_11885 [Ruminococcus callidus]
MVLAIDIGNTNVVIGGFQEQQILFVERVSPIRTLHLWSLPFYQNNSGNLSDPDHRNRGLHHFFRGALH